MPLGDGVIIACALGYMGILFGIAYYGDQRADAGRSIIANPYIYTCRWRSIAPPGRSTAAWVWQRSAGWISWPCTLVRP